MSRRKWAGDVAPLSEYLCAMHRALELSPVQKERRRKQKEKKREAERRNENQSA